jgi:hypothetical protein
VSARAPDVHDWVHECVHMCVRNIACVCMRTYARMRRMHPSVGVCVCVCLLSGGRARDGDLHQGITVHMHSIIGTRARMHTSMRALAECIPVWACAGVDAGAGARGGSAGIH